MGLRERVAAYLADHPKASDGFIAAAIGSSRNRVRAARQPRQRIERPPAPRPEPRKHQRMTTSELLDAARAMVAEGGEVSSCAIADALGISRAWGRKLLRETEALGWTTSRRISRAETGEGGAGGAKRFYALAA